MTSSFSTVIKPIITFRCIVKKLRDREKKKCTGGECRSCALAESSDLQPVSSPELRTLPSVTCHPTGNRYLCLALGSEAGPN